MLSEALQEQQFSVLCEKCGGAIVEPVSLVRADIRRAMETMTADEARYLVDLYYQIQESRKASGNQERSLKSEEPNTTIRWAFDTMLMVEGTIRKGLDDYSDLHHMGRWAKSVTGIGPVIAAGLLAHIDIERAKTAGAIWRFAGLDPTSTWGKKQKRPWNASLKVLCWKIGESFVKVSNNKNDVYGKLYQQRKARETAMNVAGEYADQAKHALESKEYRKTTEAYKHYMAGKLPPAHIHARAKRWAVKVFLCHWFEEAYRAHYGKEPPEIYSIAMLGHAHKI